ncbi:hypothetical protein [Curtobacterium sp. UCD-KPL2560]|uniref:hypothetical protein n=1 Tax=Curtobacterium sp. UCD-KPL2560 TaxID=1885315 RepID=UPI000A80B0F9|nr:hypothetical protein [Curtobacterium sp. UCD-KPL2560]
MRAGRSTTVGLVVLDAGNLFVSDVARSVEGAAAECGLAVLVGNSDDSAEREHVYVGLFEERRLAGRLTTPAAEDLSSLVLLRAQGAPVVLVERGADASGFPSAAVDDERIPGTRGTPVSTDVRDRRITGVRGRAEHLTRNGR